MPFRRSSKVSLVLLSILLLLTACSGSATNVAVTPGGPTRTAMVVETATPTPVPTPPKELDVLEYGFIQTGRNVQVGMVVANNSTDVAAEQVNYLITVSDETGKALGAQQGIIGVIFPGQTLGVTNSVRLAEGLTAASVSVQLMEVDLNITEKLPLPEIEQNLLYTNENGTYVTGLVSNPYNHPLENLQVYAIAYDTAGKINGSGAQNIAIINTKTSSGTQLAVNAAGEIARVDLYASLPNMAAAMPTYETLSGQELKLVSSGFGQSGSEAGFAMLVTNQSTLNFLQGSRFHVTAFAADGTVVAAGNGSVPLLLPSQTFGVGGSLNLSAESSIDHIEIHILTGEYLPGEPKLKMAFENITYTPGTPGKAAGTLVNPYANYAFDRMRVYAVAFDATGKIVGGGSLTLDAVAAGSRTPLEINLSTSATVAKVEMYAAPRNLEVFK